LWALRATTPSMILKNAMQGNARHSMEYAF
jgi:hypothetical protein